MHRKNCLYCGAEFTASRSDAKFHSDACRVSWNHLPDRMQELGEIAVDKVARMRELAEKYPHLKGGFDEQLVKLQERVALERLTLR